jgi:hypothetical protein
MAKREMKQKPGFLKRPGFFIPAGKGGETPPLHDISGDHIDIREGIIGTCRSCGLKLVPKKWRYLIPPTNG